jgi:hypothetical protein
MFQDVCEFFIANVSSKSHASLIINSFNVTAPQTFWFFVCFQLLNCALIMIEIMIMMCICIPIFCPILANWIPGRPDDHEFEFMAMVHVMKLKY